MITEALSLANLRVRSGSATLSKIDVSFTLKVESFAGRNFRDFASFLGVRENPREIALYLLAREISSRISFKLHENKEKEHKNLAFAKVYTRET